MLYLAGQYSGGKIKAMFDERGARIEGGWSVYPCVGAWASTVRLARGISSTYSRTKRKRDQLLQQASATYSANRVCVLRRPLPLRNLVDVLQLVSSRSLTLSLKGDVDGSIEALERLAPEAFNGKGAGEHHPQSCRSNLRAQTYFLRLLLAHTSSVSRFVLLPLLESLLKTEEIQIKLILCYLQGDRRNAMTQWRVFLSAKIEENIVGTAEIRETFKISKIGTIAGCFVTDGMILPV